MIPAILYAVYPNIYENRKEEGTDRLVEPGLHTKNFAYFIENSRMTFSYCWNLLHYNYISQKKNQTRLLVRRTHRLVKVEGSTL